MSQEYATEGPQGKQERLWGRRLACPGRKSQSAATGCGEGALGKSAEPGQHITAKEMALGCEEGGE